MGRDIGNPYLLAIARRAELLLFGWRRGSIRVGDVFRLGRFDFGPLAAVEAVVEDQQALLASGLALAFAALGRRVFGRLQLREHGPLSRLHRGDIHELRVFEVDVGALSRRLLFALLIEKGGGLARDRIAELLTLGGGNRIFLGGTRRG